MDSEEGKGITFVIKSPAGVLYERMGLRSVQLDLRDGKIGIRAGHAAMIAEVGDGEAVLDEGEKNWKMAHHSGIVVVRNDAVTVYTDALDPHEANPRSGSDQSEDEFDNVYHVIITSLLPGSAESESPHGD